MVPRGMRVPEFRAVMEEICALIQAWATPW